MASFLDCTSGGGSSTPVSSNIRHYLAQAMLPRLRLAPCTPRMPPNNHKAHRNDLHIRPERYRRLHFIHRIKRDHLDFLCLDFIQKHVPHKPVQIDCDVDPDSNEQPSIPCEGFDVETYIPAPVRHIDGLGVMWLEGNVLRTVQAVLAMMPEYRDIVKNYSFTSNDIMRDEDQKIFRYFIWERSDANWTAASSSDTPTKYIIAYQPPWILSPRDIELFADKRLRHIPSYDTHLDSGQQRYMSTHKLWAKIWDICKAHNCHTFVLTNYNQWVFGGFSKGWENGYTMGVKQAYSPDVKGSSPSSSSSKFGPKGKGPLPRRPTILEYLVYWTISSIGGLPDSFDIPPVRKEVPYIPRELPCCMYDVRNQMDSACAAYFQTLASRLFPVPGEIIIETAVDDSIDGSLPPSLIPTHPDFRAAFTSRKRVREEEKPEPSGSDWSSENSEEVPSSAGVRIDLESDTGCTYPALLDGTWKLPTTWPSIDEERNRSKVSVWIDTAESSEPDPEWELDCEAAPLIKRAPSPVRSEWSDRSLATRYPHRHQGFFNIDTTIVEEICEYDFDHMDLT